MAAPTRASQAKVYGVDVLLDDDEKSPYCEHGPTVLFEKFFKDKPSQKYYACSACRERKDCNIFQLKDEKITKGKQIIQEEIKKKLFGKKKNTVNKLTVEDNWCFDCGDAVNGNNNQHQKHNVKHLTSAELLNPTLLINPKSDKKTNAQYFFSEETCNLFTTVIKKLQFKKIICIGTPRLFEKINASDDPDKSAILLDIDDRFRYFYNSTKYLKYNLFNHFFFDVNNGEKVFTKFVEGCKQNEILIVIDPPFGGMAALLANSLKRIWGECGEDSLIATMLVFPYFLESHVSNSAVSNLRMLDYKVSYTNHPHFNNASKRGSPVRIFTNIPVDKVSLPQEYYRFCKLCQRYVYKENKHCNVCKLCTSKDGRTYVHCKLCEKCVKPGREHCDTCGSCQALSHKCNVISKEGCHVCGDSDHKRKDCPKKTSLGNKRKTVDNNTKKLQKSKTLTKTKKRKIIA